MKILKNRNGISYVKTAVWVLILSMVLSIVLAYASMMTVIQMAESNTRRVLDGFVTENSRLIYDTLKNGKDSNCVLDDNFFISEVSDELSLDFVGSFLYCKDDDDNVIYHTTKPSVSAELADSLKLRAAYTIILPVTFAGKMITHLEIPQKVTAYYNLK